VRRLWAEGLQHGVRWNGFDGMTPGGEAGALGVLSGLLGSAAFAWEPEEGHRHLCASMVYRLLTEMLEFDVQSRR
jgi:hypothetical protein